MSVNTLIDLNYTYYEINIFYIYTLFTRDTTLNVPFIHILPKKICWKDIRQDTGITCHRT